MRVLYGVYYWGVRFREGGVLLIGGKDFIVKWGVGWVEGIGGKVLEERYWRKGIGGFGMVLWMIEYI